MIAAAALILACTGQISTREQHPGAGAGGGTGGSGSGVVAGGGAGSIATGVGVGGAAPTPCVQGASLAPARLSLISDEQYRNIVHDAFGVTFPATVNITTPPSSSGTYPYNENAQVQTTTLQAYQRAADQVAALLTALPPCAAGAVNATCLEQYLRKALPVAWRRPPTDAELAGLIDVFNAGAMDGQVRQVQLTLEAALLHAAFLYRTEIGTNAATATGKIQMTPFEVAAAVSFALLNSSPDPELFARAQDGTIVQPTVLSAQVTRLMALPTVRANLAKKVSYYLDFETLPFVKKDASSFPEFAALQSTLYQSAQLFLNDVVWGGHFGDLFTSRRIYANQAMAMAYGLPPVTGTQLQAVTTSGDAYSGGVLTQPALLAASDKNAAGDDVVHRGLWIHDNLLCAPPLPPPPAGATAAAALITGSTRQQAMTRDMGCGSACHGHFDPFGLVTLSYDGIGRFRTTDPTTTPPGGPLDVSAIVDAGLLQGQGDAPVMLKGVSDLAQLFANGRQVSDCAAGTLATYLLEHNPDAQGSCELQTVRNRFQQTGTFSDLFTAILTSPAFLSRDL
jgi:Protein of unknown function (DUF1592)/Protein of unknown function (DUF1588)/Protein of unknown function (DUF1595)/Protein of unknown function (DUF1587)